MRTTVKFKLLKLQAQGFHLLVTCEANGLPCKLILDTGASQTVFDHKLAIEKFSVTLLGGVGHEAAGLGAGKMQAAIGRFKSFNIGKIHRRNFKIGLLDLSHVNLTYESIGLDPIDGILGSDFMKRHKATINFDKGTLTLWKP